MPSRKIIKRRYLEKSTIPTMEEICEEENTGVVIYGGLECNDACFFKPQKFSNTLLDYLERRILAFQEKWNPVDNLNAIPFEEFPSVKCFGRYMEASRLAAKIQKMLGLHVPVIKDPFDEKYFVVQGTFPDVCKGQAVKDILSKIGPQSVIAAGDDLNDLSMLKMAQIKIAMPQAPKELLDIADIVALPPSEDGIIQAVKEAISRI
jgi:hydroxymethylpyrimidine pyrophosphatase-like HAD family hydrolase